MEQLVLVILAFGSGILLREIGAFKQSSSRVFNQFVIYVSLPALVLLKIHSLNLATNLVIPASMAWLHFALSMVLFALLGRLLNWKRPLTGALILMAGLGNTSFVGFPLIEAFYGPGQLPTGIILDQLGSFLVLSIVAIPVAVYYGGGKKQSLKALVLRVLKFPPFLSLLLAVALVPVEFPEVLSTALDRLSQTLVPLALFSVGLQCQFSRAQLKEAKIPLTLGLAFKLVIAPTLLAVFYVLIIGSHDLSTKVTVFESAMAPMISAGIVAIENDLDAPLTNLILGIGIPLSLATTTIWYYLLAKL